VILEEETYKKFGYYPGELKPQSHKKILIACDDCGKIRESSKNTYHARCGSCISKKRTGKSNPFFGFQHSQTTKDIIGAANKGHLSGKNNPNWKGGGIKLICKNCGTIFELAKYELKKQKGFFCTRKCDFEYRTKNRKVSDTQSKVNRNMRRAVTRYIKEKKEGRRWTALVGYTLKELCECLEKQFRKGMSWVNYGEWHIDHVIPISKFQFESFEDVGFKKAWALNNLQPLWADDNMKKGDKWRWY
jgi:5-methylcytosine-specific restriction endonuclease McrA